MEPIEPWMGDYAPQLSLPSQPVDAGGGAPGNYGAQVMDLFKFGIGAWQANKAQNNAIDYKKWETTAGIVSQQGQPSAMSVNGGAQVAGMSITTMLMIGGGLLVALLVLRKAGG